MTTKCRLATENNIYPLPPELGGYCVVEGNILWLSAIISKFPKQGNFGRFLDTIESEFEIIKVPVPSPLMKHILAKRGYKLKEEWFPEPFNEMGEIMFFSLAEKSQKSLKEKQENEYK
jgi:hypothetical protein